ncbi:MAG: hypothetical protein E4G99_11415, partial [Anaerolineales bacterium]
MDEVTGQQDPQPEPKEPTVLDWVKSLLRGKPLTIPDTGGILAPIEPETQAEDHDLIQSPATFSGLRLLPAHLRLPAALFLSLIAQFLLERREGQPQLSIVLYVMAGALVFWAMWRQDFELVHPGSLTTPMSALHFRPIFVGVALIASAMTFLTARNNLFDLPTVFFWVLSIAAILLAFWEGELPYREWLKKGKAWFKQPQLEIKISWWTGLFLLVFSLTVFFRFYRLDQVPPEMVSDHAEKLLDVVDVLNGLPSIFFSRNTGREALQFYMAAATAKLFGTGISHLTLKIGTAAAGVVTLIYMYFIGKELSGRRAGLFAMLLAGVAYWPNVISRVGLRFPLYP